MTSISERLTDLAHRLTAAVDPLDEQRLGELLIAAGWTPDVGRRFFHLDEMRAYTRHAELVVEIADFGVPSEITDISPASSSTSASAATSTSATASSSAATSASTVASASSSAGPSAASFSADDDVSAAVDRIYREAETLAGTIAGELGLAPAGEFDVDPLEGWHFEPHLFRAGHWTVAVADVQQDTDLPLVVEAHFAYGADLQSRLTALVPPPTAQPTPPSSGPSPSLSFGGRELPGDYRWLIETYGAGDIGGYLNLLAPEGLHLAKAGSRIVFPEQLTVAVIGDGTVSWVMESTRPWADGDQPDSWAVVVNRPGWERRHPYGLLRFLVLEILGEHR